MDLFFPAAVLWHANPSRSAQDSQTWNSGSADADQVGPIIIGHLGFEEVEATVAYSLADMCLHTALWTCLLGPGLWQLFDHGSFLCFFFLFCLELCFTRCIGLLHGALRMDSTCGIRPLSTNRTDLRVVFTKDRRGFFVTHDISGLIFASATMETRTF